MMVTKLALAIFVQLLSVAAALAIEPDFDANSNEAPDAIPDQHCQFWGNSFSLKFHLKSCPFAMAMNPRHVQFFNNAKEALELGEKPCRFCLPPYTLEVSGKLLLQTSESNQSDNSK